MDFTELTDTLHQIPMGIAAIVVVLIVAAAWMYVQRVK